VGQYFRQFKETDDVVRLLDLSERGTTLQLALYLMGALAEDHTEVSPASLRTRVAPSRPG
jgi:hypothetical protein